MLNGASQIIGGVPGSHLDPLLLAQSQDGEATGFIMIAYDSPRKSYDILFIHGAAIIECARMTPDFRHSVNIETVRSAFLADRRASLLYLFLCPVHEIERFAATLHAEPCLKVHVNAISKRQISSLIKATGCQKGIVERNIFRTTPPRIELVEIDSRGNLPALKTGFDTGRLLLYDLEKNSEPKLRIPIGGISTLVPLRRKGRLHVAKLPAADEQPPEKPHAASGGTAPQPAPAGQKVDEFDELIKQILSSPPSQKGSTTTPSKRTKRKQTDQPTGADRMDDPEATASSSAANNPAPAAPPPHDSTEDGNPAVPKNDTGPPEPPQQASGNSDAQKYIKVFQRLFRSFRQQAFECFGPRYEAVMSQAENQVRLLEPEFDMENLTEDTVPLMLDIIEDMINRAPFLKRSKLREAAQVLVSDLYNKHYDLLEQHNAIDKVEQNYFQLKK